MTRAVHDEMVAHAIGGLPDEACGVFASDTRTGTVVRFFPLTNAANSAQIYQIDSAEYLTAEKTADETGLIVSGVMHSHTHTTNYPSPTDIADAANFDPFGSWHFVIVSLKHPVASTRSFRIVDGIVTEEPIQFRSE
jgi:proteasome lid subunit RPN8/RPN11